jgi:hypothetical protein
MPKKSPDPDTALGSDPRSRSAVRSIQEPSYTPGLLQEVLEFVEFEGLLFHCVEHLKIFSILHPLEQLSIFLNVQDNSRRLFATPHYFSLFLRVLVRYTFTKRLGFPNEISYMRVRPRLLLTFFFALR